MKTTVTAIAVALAVLTLNTFAQNPGGPSTPPKAVLDRLFSMTPEQRLQVFQTHPRLQQFITSHPEFAQKLANNGSEAGPGIVDPGHPRVNEVNQREQDQQNRIAQGIKNGSLTPQEAAGLEKWESYIQKQEAADLARNNGHLTAGEARQLNREENRLSGAIYAEKHDLDPGHPRVNEINQREQDEQNRIAQGLKNGTLTPQEAAGLEKGVSRIQQQEAADLARNNGHLTAGEARQLNREENRLSERIFAEKHDWAPLSARDYLMSRTLGMTTEQRQHFLQDHPGIQQFLTNHPEFSQKLANAWKAAAGIKDPGHPRVNEVNQREQDEQNRIAQGIKNGTLTPREAAGLEKGEIRIQQQEAADLARNNGHLTVGETIQLNREENRLSERIFAEKHDFEPSSAENRLMNRLLSMTPNQRWAFMEEHPRMHEFIRNHPEFAQKLANGLKAGPGVRDPGHPRVNEVNQREQHQQERIAQGIKNGSLTPREAGGLERRENWIRRQEARDLEKNRGFLTHGETHQLNREENRESGAISREGHEGREGRR